MIKGVWQINESKIKNFFYGSFWYYRNLCKNISLSTGEIEIGSYSSAAIAAYKLVTGNKVIFLKLKRPSTTFCFRCAIGFNWILFFHI